MAPSRSTTAPVAARVLGWLGLLAIVVFWPLAWISTAAYAAYAVALVASVVGCVTVLATGEGFSDPMRRLTLLNGMVLAITVASGLRLIAGV